MQKIVRVAVLLWIGAALGSSLRAQEQTPWVQMTIIDVNPVMVDEFLAVQQELKAVEQKAGTPWRSVSRTEVFGNPNRFLIAAPLANLAGLDRTREPSPEATVLNNRLLRCVTSQQSYGILMVPEMSKPLPPDKEPRLMVVSVARVSPGREQQYVEIMKSDFLSHFDEEEVYYLSGSLTFGGEGGFIHLFYVNNFAELDLGSPVVRAVGADGAQALAAQLSGIVTHNEQWVVRYLAELSHAPAAAETKKQ